MKGSVYPAKGCCLGDQKPSVQFSSVAQSCPTLCDPMNCNTPGLPVHHQLPEFTQTHLRPQFLNHAFFFPLVCKGHSPVGVEAEDCHQVTVNVQIPRLEPP